MTYNIPIVLFAYARPQHLRQTLDCLRENNVPLIYAFSDGPRTPDKAPAVAQVRNILRAIDWSEVVLCERETNLGLGRSVLIGVKEVLGKHEAAIIFEDDLICVPGTYEYLCAALNQYRDDQRVMSITGWTHPLVTPSDVNDLPYFDGRAECWLWGTWARAWDGMEIDAKTLMEQCNNKGIDIYKYGADLVNMAYAELSQNIWAVRLLYLHILKKGFCLRPPWSMVEHIGFDLKATNATHGDKWANPPLKACPPIPEGWPEPKEHSECPQLWQIAYPRRKAISKTSKAINAAKQKLRRIIVKSTGISKVETISVREVLDLFIPPVLTKIRRHFVHQKKNGKSLPAWEYIPEGWEYSSTHPEVTGWNVQEVLDVYITKWPKFVTMTRGAAPLGVAHESGLTTNEDVKTHNIIMSFAYALALASHNKSRLSMLDWGGGIGHYYLLAQSLLANLPIEYHCKDIPLLVDYGAKLFPEGHFHTDEVCLEKSYDFVMASTSLHYSENWREVLKGLAGACKNYLYIAKLPTVLHAPDYVFIQRPYSYGYNTEYLGWTLNRTVFLSIARSIGLTLVREFIVGECPRIVGAPEMCQYRSFLFIVSKGE